MTRAQFIPDGGKAQHQIIRLANQINRLEGEERHKAQIAALDALRKIRDHYKKELADADSQKLST